MASQPENYFQFKKICKVSPGLQIILIALGFIITTITVYLEYKTTGRIYGSYPLSITILFAPIYEEIIFRGYILSKLTGIYSPKKSLIITSLLFGLWHFKNIFYLDSAHLIYQMIYTSLILGPILGYITLRLKTIWPAVILHYLNNLLAPLTWFIVSMLWKG